MAEVSPELIEAWLARYPAAYTRQTWLNRLSTLFACAARRGWVVANPCDRLERVSVDRRPPRVLSPAEARGLWAACPQVVRPYLVLGLYAGLRPEEIMRGDWSAVNLETGTVVVDGRKTHRRRVVALEPVAVARLREHPLRRGPLAPSDSTLDRWKIASRRALGLRRWPQDLLRHTAASYLLALHGDAGRVALALGNSARVLLSHYYVPVSAADCGEFWGIVP